jgi:nucleotidyltransferase/DNA polymerase involved in DNA repair
LDVSDYIENNKIILGCDGISAGELIAKEIRRRIFEKTQLTASAGIGRNRMLAKICSDFNKPNGQKSLEASTEDIL